MIASNRRWLASALAFSLSLGSLVSRAAHADSPSPPTEEQLETARALFRDARDLHRQGKLKEAIDRALEAYRTASTPVTALESGELLVEAGRLVEARDILRTVALLPATKRESDKGRVARQDAAALAATLDGRIPKIAIAERPPGVDVWIDGKLLPPSDSAAWQGVDPGGHAFVARQDERTCKTINLVLAEGEARTIDLHEVCRPEPAPPPPESVPAPPPPTPAPATHVEEPARSNDHATNVWRWTGAAIAGAGAAAMVVGGYLGLSAKADYDAVAGSCHPRCTQDAYDARQDARARADTATATLILGAAAVTGGALLFFFETGSKETPAARVAVGPASVHFTLAFR